MSLFKRIRPDRTVIRWKDFSSDKFYKERMLLSSLNSLIEAKPLDSNGADLGLQ